MAVYLPRPHHPQRGGLSPHLGLHRHKPRQVAGGLLLLPGRGGRPCRDALLLYSTPATGGRPHGAAPTTRPRPAPSSVATSGRATFTLGERLTGGSGVPPLCGKRTALMLRPFPLSVALRATPSPRGRLTGDRKGRPYSGNWTMSVGSGNPGAGVEPHQRQFLQTQGPVARKESRRPLPFCAPEIQQHLTIGRPP